MRIQTPDAGNGIDLRKRNAINEGTKRERPGGDVESFESRLEALKTGGELHRLVGRAIAGETQAEKAAGICTAIQA
jgi:hypothetical protein